MALTSGQHRVDDHTGVVHRPHLLQVHIASGRVDLDHREVDPKREVEPAGDEVMLLLQPRLLAGGQPAAGPGPAGSSSHPIETSVPLTAATPPERTTSSGAASRA